MSTIERIDPLSDPRWLEFVNSASQGWVCHLPVWKRILETSFPHMRGHYFAIVDKETGNLRAGLPVFEVRSLLTGNRLVSIPFATLSDPLASSPEDLNALLTPVIELAHSRNCRRIEIRTTETADLFGKQGFVKSSDHVRHVLKLDAPPDQLIKKFHRTCVRQKIQRALRSELCVFEADDDRYLDDFETLHARTRRRLGLPPQPAGFFRALYKNCSKTDKLTLFMATMHDETVGGLILLHHGDRASAEVIAEDIRFRSLGLPHRLFWEAIKFSCEAGYESFDFGRTAVTNKSLVEFKGRWATEAMDLPQFCLALRRNQCPPHPTGLQTAHGMLSAIIRHCPLSVARLIGHLCYQHMG